MKSVQSAEIYENLQKDTKIYKGVGKGKGKGKGRAWKSGREDGRERGTCTVSKKMDLIVLA